MDRKIDVEMTSRLVAWTAFYQTRIFSFIPAIMIFALAWGIFMQARAGLSFQWNVLITPTIFIGFLIWVPVNSYRKSMARIKKMKTPFIHYHFTDENLNIDTDLSSGQNKWEIFKGLRKNKKVWRIVTQSGLSFVLPVEQLDEELKAFLSSKLIDLSKANFKKYLIVFGFWILFFVALMCYLKYFH